MLSRALAPRLAGLVAGLILSAGMGSLVAPDSALAAARATAVDTGTRLPAGRQASLGKTVHESVATIMARASRASPSVTPGAAPPRILPGRGNLPTNPGSSKLTSTRDPEVAPRNASAPAAQTVGTKFLGASTSDSPFVPPDSMGAVGPSQYIVMVNGRIRSFNKPTGAPDGVLNASTDNFWNVPNTSDPRIRYDRLSGRWFFTMITVTNPNTANRVLIGYTDTAAITSLTSFTFASYDVNAVHPGCLWDYDTLGIDENALYIGGDLFCGNPRAYTSTDGLVVAKNGLLSGNPTAFDFGLVNPGLGCSSPGALADGPLEAHGVDNYDPTSTVGYFIGRAGCFSSELSIARINNPAGTATNPPTGSLLALAVAPEQAVAPVPAQGSTHPLEANDNRLLSAHLRNGHLWTAHNICVDSSGVALGTANCPAGARDASRWYDIINLDTSPTLNQSGTVFDPGVSNPRFYWMPSIMVSGQGHVAMGTSAAGSAEFAEATTMGRLAGDASGTMSPAIIFQASTFAYNAQLNPASGRQRWGDYSFTSLDPNDDMTMWTIQEFTNATDSWGVEAVQLKAPPPAMPSSAGGGPFPTEQCSAIVNVTGSSTNGSGFFDPGADFPSRLQASVSGGVTVNHVTYVDPTHITLDIATPGVVAGPKDLTITNPDGQAVTANGFLNITAPVAAAMTGSGPAVTCPPVPQPVLVASAGSDNALWQQKDLGGWNPLGGRILAAPAVVSVPNGNVGAPLYIGLGADHNLWVRTASQAWRPLDDLPVYCIDNPAATVRASTLIVACQGADHALYFVQGPVTANVPPLFTRSGWLPLGGILTAGPAVTFMPGRGIDIMVVGVNNNVYEFYGGSYHADGFICIGHPAMATDPAGTSYFGCHGVDGALWWAQTDAANGFNWFNIGSLGGLLIDGPAIAAPIQGPTFYVEGLDHALYEHGLTGGYRFDGGQIQYGTAAAALF